MRCPHGGGPDTQVKDSSAIRRRVSGITRRLESAGDGEAIGEAVMEGRKGLDDVAYVRFASVYKNFREAQDFEDLLGTLGDASLPFEDAPEPAEVPRHRGRPAKSRGMRASRA